MSEEPVGEAGLGGWQVGVVRGQVGDITDLAPLAGLGVEHPSVVDVLPDQLTS